MRVFGKFLAFLVACLFVLTLPLTLWLYNTGQLFFDAAQVKAVVLDALLEENLLPAGLRAFAAQGGMTDMAEGLPADAVQELLGRLTLEDWKSLQESLLPERILVPWVSAAVDGVYAWLEGDASFPSIVLAMGEFKKNLAAEGGAQAAQWIFDALPPCTAEQAANYAQAAAEGQIIPCRLPDPAGETQKAMLLASLRLMVANLPATLDLTDGVQRAESAGALDLSQFKRQLNMAKTAARWAPWLDVGLLLLILAFAIRSLRELGRWWGIPLLLGGGLTLALGLSSPSLLKVGGAVGPLSELPSAFRDEALKVVSLFLANMLGPLVVEGGVLAGIGLVLLIMGMVIPPAEDDTLARLTPR